VSHPASSPAAGNWKENFRQLADKVSLLLERELYIAVALFLRSERGKNFSADAKVGRSHVRAFFGALEAQSDPPEIRHVHCSPGIVICAPTLSLQS